MSGESFLILTFWSGRRNKIDRTSSTSESRANQPGFVVFGGWRPSVGKPGQCCSRRFHFSADRP